MPTKPKARRACRYCGEPARRIRLERHRQVNRRYVVIACCDWCGTSTFLRTFNGRHQQSPHKKL